MSSDLKIPLILSTGGYNDKFLTNMSGMLESDILKCHEYMRFVVRALDFLNIKTSDAMFKLSGPVNTKIYLTGKIDPDLKP